MKPKLEVQLFNVSLALVLTVIAIGCSARLYVRPGGPADARPEPAEDSVRLRVLLIGDAGDPQEGGEPVLRSLTERAKRLNDKTLVVFLGDNIYERGLQPSPPFSAKERHEAEARINAQIGVVQLSGASGLFIPGNHDWDGGQAQGQSAILEQERYVESQLGERSFLPGNACPGPEQKQRNDVRVIALDTEWWLYQKRKNFKDCFPGAEVTRPEDAEKLAMQRLSEWVSDARQVLVVGHHPLDTHGAHGGFFDWRDHFFALTRVKTWLWLPTPVGGSLYVLIRSAARFDQDLRGPRNQKMVESIKSALGARGSVIYVAGHDHSLQVLEGPMQQGYTLVSGLGSASKATAVGHKSNTIFADLHVGFMELDFVYSGGVFLRVIEPRRDGQSYDVVFRRWLTGSAEN